MEQTKPDRDPSSLPAAILENVSSKRKWLFGIAAGATLGVLVLLIHLSSDRPSRPTVKERKVRTELPENVTDSINGHQWIDLGLPSGTKWATCNVGADGPEDFGEYYAWGETEPKDEYIDINSLTNRKDVRWLESHGIIDTHGRLTPQHDVATLIWGEPWRMPTDEEFEELIDCCDWRFTDCNGVNGYLVTGPNNESVFFVSAGFKQGTEAEYVGNYGDYWSATVVPELIGTACSLGYSSKAYGRRRYTRFAGRSIRPVTD